MRALVTPTLWTTEPNAAIRELEECCINSTPAAERHKHVRSAIDTTDTCGYRGSSYEPTTTHTHATEMVQTLQWVRDYYVKQYEEALGVMEDAVKTVNAGLEEIAEIKLANQVARNELEQRVAALAETLQQGRARAADWRRT